jgi:hypothetical protein
MRRFVTAAAAALTIAAWGGAAAAQDTGMASEDKPLFGRPVFLLQPSMIMLNTLSAPEGVDSETQFLARFTTVIPTASDWLSLVALVQWMPFFEPAEGSDAKFNYPFFVYGGIIPIIRPSFTGGWLTISLDPLGIFEPNNGSDPDNENAYKHNFYLEGAAVLNVGAMMMKDSPTWSGFGIHALFVQQMTGIAEDANGDKDRFNPIIVVGATLPLGR